MAQAETFAHAELNGHRIARLTENSRVQSLVATIVVVAA
jgi:hypothetical protein